MWISESGCQFVWQMVTGILIESAIGTVSIEKFSKNRHIKNTGSSEHKHDIFLHLCRSSLTSLGLFFFNCQSIDPAIR